MSEYRENKKHIWWNIGIIVATTFLAIYLPLEVVHVKTYPLVRFFYWLATGYLAADLIRRWRDHQTEILDPSPLKSRTQKIWMVIDVLSAIPFVIAPGYGVLHLIQLVKLARVGQYLNHVMQVEVQYERTLTISFFIYWSVLATHWLSCGWLMVIGLDASNDDITNYLRSLYWNITTLTSVGYGDIVPADNAQILYSIFVQLLGLGALGYLIGRVVSILSKKDPVETLYLDRIEQLTTTLKRRHLPKTLQKKILDYYRYMRNEKMVYDESAFLATVPDSFREEVAFELRKKIMQNIPLFSQVGDAFIAQVAVNLELVIATPGDYLFKKGDAGEEMFLIISGEVDVMAADEEQVLATLSDGDYFGEIALFMNMKRTASIRASTFCNLYKLEKHTFEQVIDCHPEIAAEIERKAMERAKGHGSGET